MFAGVGIGVFTDSVSAVEKIVAVKKIYEPEEQGYAQLYAEYKKKEKKILEIF